MTAPSGTDGRATLMYLRPASISSGRTVGRGVYAVKSGKGRNLMKPTSGGNSSSLEEIALREVIKKCAMAKAIDSFSESRVVHRVMHFFRGHFRGWDASTRMSRVKQSFRKIRGPSVQMTRYQGAAPCRAVLPGSTWDIRRGTCARAAHRFSAALLSRPGFELRSRRVARADGIAWPD